MGKKKSARGGYKPFPDQVSSDFQPQDNPIQKKFDKYIGRRVFILELGKGGIEYVLRNQLLHRFGKINRLNHDGGNSMVVFFATQSSATSCVRMLDCTEREKIPSLPLLSAL